MATELGDVDTVADGDWPVDPDLLPEHEAQPHVVEERGAVVVSQAQGSRRGLALAVGSVVVIAALAVALLWALARRQDATTTGARSAPPATTAVTAAPAVPSLVGLQLADAQQRLTARRLPVEVRRTPSSRPHGLVLAQSPGPGARLGHGDKVLLVVAAANVPSSRTQSTAPTQVTVPTATGLSQSAAAAALERTGLKPVVKKVPSSKAPGTVIGQSPSPGSRVDRGSTVQLEVAIPAGPPKVTMPHVVGLALAAATSQLSARGLRATVEHVTSSEASGTVLAQTPVTGAQLRRGMTVTLRVAAPPAKVDVPDVTGLDADSARQQLTAAGFRVEVENQAVADASQDGVVIDESPGGGSSAAKGSTVTVTVGQSSSP